MSTFDITMHDERHGDAKLRFRISREAPHPVEVHIGGGWQRVDRVIECIRMGVASCVGMGCREETPDYEEPR